MRVSIETRGIKMALILSKLLKISHFEAIGRLVMMWEASQDSEVIESKERDIYYWFDPEEQLERAAVISALEECDFIRRCVADQQACVDQTCVADQQTCVAGAQNWVICGNAKHAQFLSTRREAAKKGGGVRARLSTKNKELQDVVPRAKEMLKAHAKEMIQPNAMLCYAMQSNAKEKEKSQKKEKERGDESGLESKLEEIYQHYPKRLGGARKAEGLKKLKSKIKKKEIDIDQFFEQVKRYRALCEKTKKTKTKFVMQFSTFVNNWNDDFSLHEPSDGSIDHLSGMERLDALWRMNNGLKDANKGFGDAPEIGDEKS